MKKIIFAGMFLSLFFFGIAHAQVVVNQNGATVNYSGQEPIDSDLDGLTDQGEIQKYKTNPNVADSDGDGYFDVTEALNGTDPLDADSNLDSKVAELQGGANNDIPWAWYISRASGLVGFALLYISIFLGLTLRIPFLRKFFAPLYALNAHCWIALQATVFAFIHGTILIFDKFMKLSLADVLIPFHSSFEKGLVALGILSFYLMIILVVTSYGRKLISHGVWRAVHFLNIGLYVITIIHAYFLGTDMKNEIVRNIFVSANIFLILLMLTNMFLRIRDNINRKRAAALNSQNVSQ